jgi:nitroreductase
MVMNREELDEVIRKRKMIRKYDQNREVPEKIINKLIDNASRAPSAGHTQVQEFIVIKDASTKRKLKLASVNQEQVEEAPVLIVACSNTSRSVGRYGERGREFYSIIDGAFASLLILLTATNEGLGHHLSEHLTTKKYQKYLVCQSMSGQ